MGLLGGDGEWGAMGEGRWGEDGRRGSVMDCSGATYPCILACLAVCTVWRYGPGKVVQFLRYIHCVDCNRSSFSGMNGTACITYTTDYTKEHGTCPG